MQVIVYTNEFGSVSVCRPSGELTIAEVQAKDTPAGSIIVDDSIFPDNDFFNAWELNGSTISVNIAKAKSMAHEKRREARSAEFAPLDIKVTIPSEATAAEAARQVVRDKYTAMQTAIDAAITVDEIKASMP
jgi:hypothetical protein